MSVTLDQVSFAYPGGGAGVREITLEIREGELLAVIGPSGCGKSTILKLIAGFLMPQSGRITISGEDMTHVPPRKRDLGIVFQNYALFPHMTLAENVGYALKLRQVPAAEAGERVREALGMVGLGHLADRLPRSLSGGQQQRVALARALVFRPRALLLDEPLSALDATLRGEMRDEIARLQRLHGIATLHITHDQEEALSMAHRVAVMREGRILQVDTPEGLYARPANRAVAAFVGQANLFEGEVLDAVTVRTAIGDLACAAHAFPRGAAVAVLIRPEAIRPADHAEGSNRFAGSVTRDRFLGALRRFDFTLQSGQRLALETESHVAPPGAIELPRRSAGHRDGTRGRQQKRRDQERKPGRSGLISRGAFHDHRPPHFPAGPRRFRARLVRHACPRTGPANVTTGPELYAGEKALYDEALKEGMVISNNTGPTWANWAALFRVFGQRYPNINLVYNDVGSGVAVNALDRTKNRPQVDTIYYFGANGVDAQKRGLLAPFKPTNFDKLPALAKHPNGEWFTIHQLEIVFIVNKKLVKNVPKSFADLAKPEYKGNIVYLDPRSTGVGQVFTWAANFAQGGSYTNLEPGLKYMEQLHKRGNVLRVVGTTPYAQFVKGEIPIWVNFVNDGLRAKFMDGMGDDVEVVSPAEGTVAAPYTISLVKNGPNPTPRSSG